MNGILVSNRGSSGNKPGIPWSRVCLAADMCGAELVVLRAERVRGKISFKPASAEDLAGEEGRGIPSATCLPAGESLAQWISAPYASLGKARRVFSTLLDIAMPFPVEDCVIEFLDAHRDSDAGCVRSLAVAARHVQIAARLELCGRNGFDPVVLDPETLVLWTQSLAELPPSGEETAAPRAVLRAEPDRFCLVLGRGREFTGAHCMRELSHGELLRILRARLGPGAEGEGVRWCLCGSLAADAGVRRAIEELPAGLRRSIGAHIQPETFAARGLATRALLPGPLRMNLRGEHFRHADAVRRAGGQERRAAALFLAAGLLLCAANITAMAWLRGARANVDVEFTALRDELLGYKLPVKGERAVNVVAAELASRKEKARPFQAAFAPSLVTRAGRIIELAKRDALLIEAITLTQNAVAISGTAPSPSGWAGLLSYLAKEGYGAVIKPGDAGPDGRVPFEVATGGGGE